MRLISKLLINALLPYLICVPLVGFIYYQSARQEILKETIAYTNSKVNAKATFLHDYLYNWLQELEIMARTPVLLQSTLKSKIQYLVNERLAEGDRIDGLYLELNGNVYSTAGHDFENRDRYFYPRLKQGKAVISRVLVSRDTGNPVIVLISSTPKGGYTGAVGVAIRYHDLLRKLQDPDHDGTMTLLLGKSFSTARQQTISAILNFFNSSHAFKHSVKRNDLDSALSLINKKYSLGVAGPFQVKFHNRWYLGFVKDVRGTPFHVVSLCPQAMLFKEIFEGQKLAIVLIVAFLLIALISTLRLYWGIVRPLHRLTAAHEMLGSGDLLLRTPVTGNDEIAALARSFNRMSERLQEAAKQRKSAEARAEEAQKQILYTAKMVSIGRLASSVAHEINNPLTIIQGHFKKVRSWLRNQPTVPEEIESSSEKTVQAIERVRNIVEELRLLVRKDAGNTEIFSVRDQIMDAYNFIQSLLDQEKITVDCHFPHDFVNANGDPGKFQQVIVNMLSNAKDALSKQSKRLITIRMGATREHVIVDISDNGCGISPDEWEKVLEPFYTTKPTGTGLGLAISHSIIAEMDGQLLVLRSSAEGTTFRIKLPRVYGMPTKSPAPSPWQNLLHSRRFFGHALVVDDEFEVGQIFCEILANLGLEAKFAQSEEQVFSALQKTKFDYVFTDQQLEQTTGLELLKELYRRFQSSKNFYFPKNLFIVTGGIAVDLSSVSAPLRQYIKGMLYKPFVEQEIAQALADLQIEDSEPPSQAGS